MKLVQILIFFTTYCNSYLCAHACYNWRERKERDNEREKRSGFEGEERLAVLVHGIPVSHACLSGIGNGLVLATSCT